MTNPYPGIPAGILDEDLEEHMSEKGSFDAGIRILKVGNGILQEDLPQEKREPIMKAVCAAIRVLEAAGKIDKAIAMATLSVLRGEASPMAKSIGDECECIRTLLESLPDA